MLFFCLLALFSGAPTAFVDRSGHVTCVAYRFMSRHAHAVVGRSALQGEVFVVRQRSLAMPLLEYDLRNANLLGQHRPFEIRMDTKIFDPPASMLTLAPSPSRWKRALAEYQQLTPEQRVPWIIRNAVYWPACLAKVMEEDYKTKTVKGQRKVKQEETKRPRRRYP